MSLRVRRDDGELRKTVLKMKTDWTGEMLPWGRLTSSDSPAYNTKRDAGSKRVHDVGNVKVSNCLKELFSSLEKDEHQFWHL